MVAKDLEDDLSGRYLRTGRAALDRFAEHWDKHIPRSAGYGADIGTHLSPFFAFPQEIRKVIYTTNAIESMNRGLRKIIKTKGAFPTDEAARKLLYLALLNLSRRWTRPIVHWTAAINQFVIMYEDRVPII